jgi:drug/metabolite transporter (DMT)-like permease
VTTRTETLALPHDDVPRALLFMGYAAILIPLLNATAKYLGAEAYPTVEIVWARYAGHFLWMVATFAPRRGIRLLVTARPGLQLLRSTLLFTSTAIYFTALYYIPLSTATAISFTGPFMVTLLSPVMLGEAVGWRRWVTVALGFVGALIVVRPGADAVDSAVFLVFASAACSALYQLFTRKLAAHDAAETSITYIALSGFLCASAALPFYWQTPRSLLDALLFIAIGGFGGFGHYFIVRAYELAPAPVVTPFNYGQVLGAALLGYAVFGQFPDLWTWLGTLVIVGSGIYMIYREGRRARRMREEQR